MEAAQAACSKLHELFVEGDADQTGHLDKAELAVVFRKYYKATGVSRKLDRVQDEVDDAMTRWDQDGNGHLDFYEFVKMFVGDEAFKFKIPEDVKESVLRIIETSETLQASVYSVRKEMEETQKELKETKRSLAKAQVELKDCKKHARKHGVSQVLKGLVNAEHGEMLRLLKEWRLNATMETQLENSEEIFGNISEGGERLAAWEAAREVLENGSAVSLSQILTRSPWRDLIPCDTKKDLVKQLEAASFAASQAAVADVMGFDGDALQRGLDAASLVLARLSQNELTYRIKVWRTKYGIYKRNFALADIQLVLCDLTGKSVRMSGKRNTTFDTWLHHWCQYKKVPTTGIVVSYKEEPVIGIETAHDYGLKNGSRITVGYPLPKQDEEQVEANFQKALLFVKNAKDLDLTTDEQLKLYGFYKCATVGVPTKVTPKPSAWDMTGQAKFAAWKKVGAVSKDVAKAKYCEAVDSIAPGWLSNEDPESPGTPGSPGSGYPMSPGTRAMKMVGELLDENHPMPKDPLPLDEGLEWCNMDITDPAILDEVHDLLARFYVSNTGGNFRIAYDKEFLKWDMCPEGVNNPEWQVGIRMSGKLVGFISGVPVKVSIYGDVKDACEINFFCLHSDCRGVRSGNSNLARVIITEITRRVYNTGVRLALYTGAQEMPHAMSRTSYYHRKLNCRKLVESGFSSLPDGQTIDDLEEEFAVSEVKLNEGSTIRRFEPQDAERCHYLLNTHYDKKMELFRVMTVDEVSHVLTNKQNVVYSWVVENAEGVVTDFVSFYSLPSAIVDTATDTVVGELGNAYLWYTVATSLPRRILIDNVVALAKQEGFDAFTALAIAGLPEDLTACKFVKGTGTLRYYLFNWRGQVLHDSLIGFVAL